MFARLSCAAALLLALSVAPSPVFAQELNLDWGKIPDEHLSMQSFPPDTAASAVILGDRAEVVVNGTGELRYRRHVRIKILDAAGIEWATSSVSVDRNAKRQKLTNLDGHTINLEGGKARRTKMGKDAIFTEKRDNGTEVTRFTLPAVSAGSVIEYRHEVISQSPLDVPGWNFQDEEPTLASEYTIEYPARLNYVFATLGGTPEISAVTTDLNRPYGDAKRTRWASFDLPAVRREPYMRALSDYMLGMQAQLHGYVDPSIGYVPVLDTWEELATELVDGHFRRAYKPSRGVRRLAEDVTAGLSDKREIADALYDHVVNNVEWDGAFRLFDDQNPDDVLSRKLAGGTQINALLVGLLNAAGVEASMALISTRDHGAPIEGYPIVGQFDYALAYAHLGRGGWYLDATDRHRPSNLLPAWARVGRAWTVSPKDPVWQDQSTSGSSRRMVVADVGIDESGTLRGKIFGSDGGYAAIASFEYVEDADIADFVQESIVNVASELVVDSARTLDGGDNADLFKWEANMALGGHAQMAGDFIYVSPTFALVVGKNPFERPERSFPVDVNYPDATTFVLNLTIPDGYEVEDLPRPVQISVASGDATYRRVAEVVDGKVVMNARLHLKKALYDARYYQQLRTMYTEIVSAEEDQLVLRKSAATPTGARTEGGQ